MLYGSEGDLTLHDIIGNEKKYEFNMKRPKFGIK